MKDVRIRDAFKALLFVLCLVPSSWLAWSAAFDQLGPNPAEALIRELGDWTLTLLVVVLLITPLRRVTGWHELARYRRMTGLYVFFYATLHWIAYAWFDMGFVWSDIGSDALRRPFILVGTVAWFFLFLLAATSFDRAIRWLGATRWQKLHRLVYVLSLLSVLHFLWMRAGKNDYREVGVYASFIGVALGWRLWRAALKKAKSTILQG